MTPIIVTMIGLMVVLLVTQIMFSKPTRLEQLKYKIANLVVSVVVFIGVLVCIYALVWQMFL